MMERYGIMTTPRATLPADKKINDPPRTIAFPIDKDTSNEEQRRIYYSDSKVAALKSAMYPSMMMMSLMMKT